MSTIDAFPLAWPLGWKRTPAGARKTAAYKVTMGQARDELLRGLRLLGAVDIVISSEVPVRRDGIPYSNYLEPDDPGVAVYWKRKGMPCVMACDQWRKVHQNVRALGLAVEGLRAIERSGASQILERAFTGFAALPTNAGDNGAPHWRDVFCVSAEAVLNRAQMEELYRELARHAHPDQGGNVERMIELNRAREQALLEVAS